MPGGHPVPVPALTVHVKYAIAGGAGVSLASGPAYTAHADFFNAWNQAELTKLVQNCINAQVECGARGRATRSARPLEYERSAPARVRGRFPVSVVEIGGLEPPTSALRTQRSPN